MELLTIASLTGLVGVVIGLILGTLLGWRRVVEIYDENESLRIENTKLKTASTQFIEITDKRPQAVDITKDYFNPF